MKTKADYTLDVRGTIAPFSLLKVSMLFQQMKPSEVVEVLGCDADMRQDLARLLPDAVIEVLSAEQAGNRPAISIVRFRKKTN